MPVKFIRAPILLLVCLLMGCEQSSAHWQEVQREGLGLAVYLDANSIKRDGLLVTFWTRLSSTSWLKRFSGGELRTKMQIDCQQMRWRQIGGGYYLRGQQRYPVRNLTSGDVPKTGYIHSLYIHVC